MSASFQNKRVDKTAAQVSVCSLSLRMVLLTVTALAVLFAITRAAISSITRGQGKKTGADLKGYKEEKIVTSRCKHRLPSLSHSPCSPKFPQPSSSQQTAIQRV